MQRRLAPLVFLFSVAGCDSPDATTPTDAPAAAKPDLRVSGTELVTGFADGIVRERALVNGFRINSRPVSQAQYDACVEAGRCEPRDPSCFERTKQLLGTGAGHPSAAASCVQPRDASAYCDWLGTRLPTLNEWLLAARGTAPKRFAKGDEQLTCLDHPLSLRPPLALTPVDPGLPPKVDSAACGAANRDLNLGSHPGLTSPAGMQDVLLMPAELLATDDLSPFPACGSSFSACIVLGDEPGEIRSVHGLDQLVEDDPGFTDRVRPSRAFAFRCVQED